MTLIRREVESTVERPRGLEWFLGPKRWAWGTLAEALAEPDARFASRDLARECWWNLRILNAQVVSLTLIDGVAQ